MKKTILITGCAGFIGFHLCRKLLKEYRIIGIDKLSNYYSIKLKKQRIEILKKNKNFKFYKIDLSKKNFSYIFKKKKMHSVIHLAAQAGVRNSIYKPYNYLNDNIIAQVNLYESLKNIKINKFIYASSSSVYGSTSKKNFSESDELEDPLSFYSATKQSVERISKYYSKFFKIPSIGIRFFTCYGPWGRPDLSITQITDSIIVKKEVTLLNNGKTQRDYTYIDDTVDGIVKCLNLNMKNKFHEIYNLGTGKTYSILKISQIIGKLLNIRFKIKLKKHHPTDMTVTKSNMKKSRKYLKYNPKIKLEIGLKNYLKWHLKHRNNQSN